MMDASASTEPMTARPPRDELIQLGLPLVRRLAFRLARRLPPNIDVGDLIGAGTEGLLKAIEAYDPTRIPRFESYAEMRIRGAMLDELRTHDVMTRHGRQRMAEVTKAVRKLELELKRAPEEQEIAQAMGMQLENYQKLAEDLSRGPALARLGEVDPDDVAHEQFDASMEVQAKQLRAQLVEAIRKLPERTQQVLALYYQEECTQAEIGQILGVTESRVCQLLGDATVRIRASLKL
jgi:RNA polymerase sigma factor for flagellar operon FliA